MTKTFKDFLVNKNRTYCSICGKEIKKVVKVNIRCSNPLHRYQTSGRPVIYTYNLKLCHNHFKELNDSLNKLIQNE